MPLSRRHRHHSPRGSDRQSQGSPRVGAAQPVKLPVAARRWLDAAVPSGVPDRSRVWVGQRGSMDADGRWLSFTGTGTYEARPLSYDWRARLRLMLGVWALVRDGYAGDEGWGGAWLYGIKSMGQRTGPEVLVTQVIRNLAELAWVPDLARAEPTLRWSDAGERAFEIEPTGRRARSHGPVRDRRPGRCHPRVESRPTLRCPRWLRRGSLALRLRRPARLRGCANPIVSDCDATSATTDRGSTSEVR